MDPFSRTTARRRVAVGANAQWTAKRVAVYTLAAVVGVFVFVQLFTKVYQPYMRHLADANKLYRESYEYLTNEDGLCVDNEENHKLRLKLKTHYDKCDDARAIVDSWPQWHAFGRLMDDFDFCKDSCFRVQFDLLSTLGIMFMIVVSGIALLLALVVGGLFVYCYRTLQTEFDLPYKIPLIDKVATARHTHHTCTKGD